VIANFEIIFLQCSTFLKIPFCPTEESKYCFGVNSFNDQMKQKSIYVSAQCSHHNCACCPRHKAPDWRHWCLPQCSDSHLDALSNRGGNLIPKVLLPNRMWCCLIPTQGYQRLRERHQTVSYLFRQCQWFVRARRGRWSHYELLSDLQTHLPVCKIPLLTEMILAQAQIEYKLSLTTVCVCVCVSVKINMHAKV